MKCPRCQHENRPTAKFCEDCANPLNGASPPPESNAHLATEVETLSSALTESLAQQTATSEILRVISQSPTDVRPVFETIVRNAVQLCDAVTSGAFRFDGGLIYFEAEYYKPALADVEARLEAFRRRFPMSPNRETIAARVILDCAVVHISDIENDPETPEASREVALAVGYRSILSVPMLRDGRPIGAISVARATRGTFSDHHIALLKTFADRAVIAVENVRLFTELQEKNRALTAAHAQVTEALEQQTATSEILRVISGSPTDIQPVFDTIARSAMRLCGGAFAVVVRYDGDLMHLGAYAHVTTEGAKLLQQNYPRRPGRDHIAGRAILEGTVIHVADVQADAEYAPVYQHVHRHRASLAVPMLRDGGPIGVIAIGRLEVRPFTDQEITLLQTFADQAVIAIENVRLFTELQQKNDALTQAHAQVSEALDRQTATSEILRVISQSPTDVQPVFDAIAQSAVRLCDAVFGAVYRLDDELIHMVALTGVAPEKATVLREMFPIPLASADSTAAQAIVERSVVHVSDTEAPGVLRRARDAGRAIGFRNQLLVPMLRGGEPIGIVSVSRREPGPYSETQIELLKTFAAQAVIAIENVRLFKELEARTQELTRSVSELQALGEVGQAIS